MGNQYLFPLEVLPTRGTLERPVLGMGGLVEPELGPVREDLPTLVAAVGLIPVVDPAVGREGDLLVETSPADGTGEGSLLTRVPEGNWGWQWLVLPHVDPLVVGEGDLLGEGLTTGSTGEGVFTDVGAAVDDDAGLVDEGCGAVGAGEGAFPSVVDRQLGLLGKALPTLTAGEGPPASRDPPTGDSRSLLIFARHLSIDVGLDIGTAVGVGIIAIGIGVNIGVDVNTGVFAASLIPATLMDAVVLDQGNRLAEVCAAGEAGERPVTGVGVLMDGEV